MGIIYEWSSIASGGGSGSGVDTYPTLAAFPPTAADGTLALALDTDILYAFNAGSMTWVPIGAPIAIAYAVDLFTLSPTDITNKFVTLSSAPSPASKTILTVIGGPIQDYGTDFTVSGSTLSWSGLFLDGVLVSGDKLIVQFI
jgi:hypothetical protein